MIKNKTNPHQPSESRSQCKYQEKGNKKNKQRLQASKKNSGNVLPKVQRGYGTHFPPRMHETSCSVAHTHINTTTNKLTINTRYKMVSPCDECYQRKKEGK